MDFEKARAIKAAYDAARKFEKEELPKLCRKGGG